MVATDRFHCIMSSVLIYRISYAYPWGLFHWLNDNDTIAPVSVKWPWISGQYTLQWRHNGRDSISNHQPHDCFLNPLFRHRSKKTSKFWVTGLCAGNSPHKWPVTRKVSIWWCHETTPSKNKAWTVYITPWAAKPPSGRYIYIYIFFFFLGGGELISALMSYSV